MSTQRNVPGCFFCVSKDKQIAELQAENERLKSENKRLIKRLEATQRFLEWEDKLFATSSDNLSDAEKVIARLIPRVERGARSRETTDSARDDGLTRVFREEFAKGSGKSQDRVGATLRRLEEAGLVRYKVERGYERENNEPRSYSLLASTPALRTLDVTPAARNHGNGQRHFICKACHHEIPQEAVRRVYEGVCHECGTINIYDLSKNEDKAWVVDDMTAAHWDDWYEDEEARPEPPPRPCIICGVENWQWDAEAKNYYCGNHQQKAVQR